MTQELGKRSLVMGIVNATPDSFSDGGRFRDPSHAIDVALQMVDDGADWIDVGGESTRPGANPVSAEEERSRVVPVIEGLRAQSSVRISIDTIKASVAAHALDAGADLVNDVSALRDPEMLSLIIQRGCPVVLMHMRGDPATMQRNTGYEDLIADVRQFLLDQAEKARLAGVAGDKILLDPGIGFGKSAEGNLALIRSVPIFNEGGYPLLIGASRKSFLGKLFGLEVDQRTAASVAAAVYASVMGAHVFRVHDVKETVQALRLTDALHSYDA